MDEEEKESNMSELIIENYERNEYEEKLNDVIITQCIICIIILLGLVVFNIFYPQAAEILLNRYAEVLNMNVKENFKDIITEIKNVMQNT